jgi:hypothetical protein
MIIQLRPVSPGKPLLSWWLIRDRIRCWILKQYFTLTPVRGELNRLREDVRELQRQLGLEQA